jgi:hypothetical protein
MGFEPMLPRFLVTPASWSTVPYSKFIINYNISIAEDTGIEPVAQLSASVFETDPTNHYLAIFHNKNIISSKAEATGVEPATDLKPHYLSRIAPKPLRVTSVNSS